MNKKLIQFAAAAVLVTGLLSAPVLPESVKPVKQVEAKGKTYTITPKSKPKKKNYLKSNKYTKYTKNYYTLRDRLESLEKSKGGTIIFKKGTYTYTNAVFVPSNVKLIFRDGVVIKKGTKTGARSLKPSTSIFQLVKPSKSKKKKVYGKYNGTKNVTFEGQGNVTIDLKYFNRGIAIIAGHNKNIKINNIKFRNMKNGHFIEMDANQNSSVTNCSFTNAKGDTVKEAINLDTPDKTTKGWSQPWSKFDKTPNKDVTISRCYFSNLGRSIGTHKFSSGKYHTNITIKNCTIKGMKKDAIRMMNWKSSKITDNVISGTKKGNFRAILGSGVYYPVIKDNKFINFDRAVQFMPWKNSGPGKNYKTIYNKFSDYSYRCLKQNKCSGVRENFVRINWRYKDFAAKHSKTIYLEEY